MTSSVFISSTSLDLRDHRAAVAERITQQKFEVCQLDGDIAHAIEDIRGLVAKSDVFVGIIAHRYGHVSKRYKKSVNELAYDEAVRQNIPRRMYIVDPNHDLQWDKSANPEDKQAAGKVKSFKKRIEKEQHNFFTTPEDLAGQVQADLKRLLPTLPNQKTQRVWNGSSLWQVILAALGLIAAVLFGILTLLPQSQLNPFLQSIGLIQPTPLEGRVCSDEEVCVVIAQFTGERGGDQQINMLEVLNQAAAEVGDVSIIPIDYPLENRTQAQAVGETYNATLVIYGRVAAGGVTVNYEVTREEREVRTQVEGNFRTSAAQVENFDVFLYKGMQSRYILSFTVGQLHYFNNRYAEALRVFNTILTELDGNQTSEELKLAALHFYSGNSYGQLEDNAAAIAAYSEAIRLDPAFVAAYNNRGVALGQQGKFAEAIADFTTSIHLDPDSVAAYINRGTALRQQGKLDEAIADYTEAIRLVPDLVAAYNNRGSALRQQGKFTEAIADFTTSIRLDPDDADAYSNRGVALWQQGKLDEAIADYTEAIRLDPDHADAYSNRGVALWQQGKLDEAIADYTEAIRLHPDDALAYSNRGAALWQQGKLDEAIADYTEAIRLHPDHAGAYNNRGVARYDQGKLDEAITDYSEAIRLDPDSTSAYWGRGSAYYDKREYALAMADYRTYLRLTGQLEPIMVERIAEMEAALGTPTAVATP